MKSFPSLLLLLAGAFPAFAQSPAPTLKVRPQTIDAKIQIGYGLAIADVDGDGKPDILLADAKQIVWYRNPGWEKFVMAENLTPKDNVCIAARDLDGDGKCEVAVGAEWNPGDTVGSGAVFLLEPPADRTQRWKPVQLPHEPTTHRMHWMKDEKTGKPFLAVLPLHGRGNKNNEGEGVKFLAYPWPWKADSQPIDLFRPDSTLHATHNFDLRPDGKNAIVATKEGVHDTSGFLKYSKLPAGEARRGTTGNQRPFIATIEPMHGNMLAVYYPPQARESTMWWDHTRQLLDESLIQGHALATGDLLGTGGDQIVVGWRGSGKAGEKVGIKLYASTDSPAAWSYALTTATTTWKLAALIDDNQMACEDLKLADLNGDGRPDIIAAGRATKNVIIYWNETPKPTK